MAVLAVVGAAALDEPGGVVHALRGAVQGAEGQQRGDEREMPHRILPLTMILVPGSALRATSMTVGSSGVPGKPSPSRRKR